MLFIIAWAPKTSEISYFSILFYYSLYLYDNQYVYGFQRINQKPMIKWKNNTSFYYNLEIIKK